MPFTIKQNDTLPSLPFQMFEADGTTPLDLSAAMTVNMVSRDRSSGVMLFKKPCVISNALQGRGYYDWSTGDTAGVGTFDYEFEITWNSGDIQTVPVDSYLSYTVVDDLG